MGEVTVTARYNDAAGVVHVAEQLYRVRETAALPRRLAVEGWPYERPAGLPVGGAVRLSVAAVCQDGTRDTAVDARWVSTNDDVATITPTGDLVTGVAAGTFGVEVASSGLEASLADLRVVDRGPGSNKPPHVRIECDPCRVETYEEVRLQAVATDPEGMALSPEWQSTRGAFSAPRGLRVSWYSGPQTGPANITVVVTDDVGHQARASVRVDVVGPDRREPAVDHPPVAEFVSCSGMHDAGWSLRVGSAGGNYDRERLARDWTEHERRQWRAAEIAVYAFNWRRFDYALAGHACAR